QTASLFRFTLRDMRHFRWQNITAALFDRHTALATGATAATGRRDKNPVAGERVKQLIPCRGTDLILRIVIDINDHIPGIDQRPTSRPAQPSQLQYSPRAPHPAKNNSHPPAPRAAPRRRT